MTVCGISKLRDVFMAHLAINAAGFGKADLQPTAKFSPVSFLIALSGIRGARSARPAADYFSQNIGLGGVVPRSPPLLGEPRPLVGLSSFTKATPLH
jgi:hypothetical protein